MLRDTLVTYDSFCVHLVVVSTLLILLYYLDARGLLYLSGHSCLLKSEVDS